MSLSLLSSVSVPILLSRLASYPNMAMHCMLCYMLHHRKYSEIVLSTYRWIVVCHSAKYNKINPFVTISDINPWLNIATISNTHKRLYTAHINPQVSETEQEKTFLGKNIARSTLSVVLFWELEFCLWEWRTFPSQLHARESKQEEQSQGSNSGRPALPT